MYSVRLPTSLSLHPMTVSVMNLDLSVEKEWVAVRWSVSGFEPYCDWFDPRVYLGRKLV